MSLVVGTRLGSYEIVDMLGAGGMGEVYRARDTTLGREVAIKVLFPALNLDPQRLARFEREARVLAALNHPNVGAIYGVERLASPTNAGPGLWALVLELVEGETLAAKLTRAPSGLPLPEVLPIARQIVAALDAAHEKGIVHRDLKPANIKVTPDGFVKVLDFGIAKVASGDAESSAEGRTVSSAATRAGQVIGTPAYMSPEAGHPGGPLTSGPTSGRWLPSVRDADWQARVPRGDRLRDDRRDARARTRLVPVAPVGPGASSPADPSLSLKGSQGSLAGHR
jgi:serine/threonine protein kinase